jgi:hypothetical protein
MITDELKGIIAGVVLAIGLSAAVISHHYGYVSGRNGVIAADSAALAKQIQANAAIAAKDQAAASAAEKSYEAELSSIRAAATDALDPVSVCVQPRSSAPVPKAAGHTRRARRAAAAASVVQQVSPGHSGAGPSSQDITGLLRSLAASADALSAQLRSVQSLKQ